MKKSLIALAVAGALTAPIVAQADATLYGVAQFRLIDEDTKSLNADMAKTRLGVKGTVDNDIEGLTTGYQFEWEFSGADANDADGVSEVRKSNVYLSGAFGQATFGKQNNPAAAVKKADVFNRNSAAMSLISDRIESAVTYVTPTIAGFEAYAGFIADGSTENATAASTTTSTTMTVGGVPVVTAVAADAGSEDADAYTVGANYSVGGLGLSISYEETNPAAASSDVETIGFGASYTLGDLYLAGTYEGQESDASTAEPDYYQLAATYGIGKFTVGAQYEVLDTDVAGVDEREKALVGVNYALGSSASLNVEYADYNSEAETAGLNDNLVLQYTIGF